MNLVVSHNSLESQMLLGVKTHLSPKQIKIIASFSAAYPTILACPKLTQSAVADFSTLKSYVDWDYEDGRRGLSITLTRSMQGEVEALKGQLEARLGQYHITKDLCLKILQENMDFWNSYVPMLTA